MAEDWMTMMHFLTTEDNTYSELALGGSRLRGRKELRTLAKGIKTFRTSLFLAISILSSSGIRKNPQRSGDMGETKSFKNGRHVAGLTLHLKIDEQSTSGEVGDVWTSLHGSSMHARRNMVSCCGVVYNQLSTPLVRLPLFLLLSGMENCAMFEVSSVGIYTTPPSAFFLLHTSHLSCFY